MNLTKGDIHVIARYRAGNDKLMAGMATFGTIWVILTIVALFVCTFNRDAFILGVVGVCVTAVWCLAYILLTEIKTSKLATKLKEEYEKDIKS